MVIILFSYVFFFSGCAVGYFEIENSAYSDLDLVIKKENSDDQKDISIKKGEKISIVIQLGHPSIRATFYSPIKNTVIISLKNSKNIFIGPTVAENETTTITLKTNFSISPDSRLTGTWKSDDDGAFSFYGDNNKCKTTSKIWNRKNYDGFFNWKIESGNIRYKRDDGHWKKFYNPTASIC